MALELRHSWQSDHSGKRAKVWDLRVRKRSRRLCFQKDAKVEEVGKSEGILPPKEPW